MAFLVLNHCIVFHLYLHLPFDLILTDFLLKISINTVFFIKHDIHRFLSYLQPSEPGTDDFFFA